MNRIKDYGKLATDISNWIKQYADSNNIKSLVVGISGGIDSAVVSTLCAMTELPTYVVCIDIHSKKGHIDTALTHSMWLSVTQGSHVTPLINCLDAVMDTFTIRLNSGGGTGYHNDHADANTRSRLRMVYLYHLATCYNGIVVGTGNKVEDFGVGFYTKYGDGGVDISPIADLYKTEVRKLGRHLGISEDILNAAPTDGLWADGRTDEQQIGATYEELEYVMEEYEAVDWTTIPGIEPFKQFPGDNYTKRQMDVINIYARLNKQNQHKMQPIPIYKLPL